MIEDCDTYDDAIKKLEAAYLKPPSEIHDRHLLQTRAQRLEESIEADILALNRLVSDCALKDVTAKINRKESIRDSFIRGLRSSAIRARLLENSSLDLTVAIHQPRVLEQAQIRSKSYFPRLEDLIPAVVVPTPWKCQLMSRRRRPLKPLQVALLSTGTSRDALPAVTLVIRMIKRQLCPA